MSDISAAKKPISLRVLLGVLVQFAVSLGLIYWALRQVEVGTLATRLGGVGWIAMAAIGALMMMQVVLVAWRWRRINAALAIGGSFAWHLRLVMSGLFFSQLLPSNFGGDAYRVWAVARSTGAGFSRAFGSVICDRAIGLASMLAVIVLTLPLFAIRIGTGEAFAGLALIALGGLGLFVLLVWRGKVPLVLSMFRLVEALTAPIDALRAALSTPREWSIQALSGTAVHILTIPVVLILAMNLSVSLTLAEAAVLVPPVMLMTTLPISIAGWGVREGAMVTAFTLIGASAADAVVLSVAYGLANLAIGLTGGLAWGLTRLAPGRTP